MELPLPLPGIGLPRRLPDHARAAAWPEGRAVHRQLLPAADARGPGQRTEDPERALLGGWTLRLAADLARHRLAAGASDRGGPAGGALRRALGLAAGRAPRAAGRADRYRRDLPTVARARQHGGLGPHRPRRRRAELRDGGPIDRGDRAHAARFHRPDVAAQRLLLRLRAQPGRDRADQLRELRLSGERRPELRGQRSLGGNGPLGDPARGRAEGSAQTGRGEDRFGHAVHRRADPAAALLHFAEGQHPHRRGRDHGRPLLGRRPRAPQVERQRERLRHDPAGGLDLLRLGRGRLAARVL